MVMHRRLVRIAYSDFWPTFDPADNWFSDVLATRFQLQLSDQPEVLLHSVYGAGYQQYRCTRLLVSFENRGWGFSRTDWAATSDYHRSPRHLRLPLWATLLPDPFEQPVVDPQSILAAKTGFAATVVSNGHSRTRERVHDQLASYREVASGGRHRNNVGGPVVDKLSFLSHHKFSLAFENSSYPGYSTEKLLHALQADTVPIYWGDPLIGRDFNTRRFLSYHEFPSERALIDRVIELDRDDDAYCAMLSEPWFAGGVTPECARRNWFLDWFETAITSTAAPVATHRYRPDIIVRRISDRRQIHDRYRSRVT